MSFILPLCTTIIASSASTLRRDLRYNSGIGMNNMKRIGGDNMACEHKRLKCTNNVFFCMDCGAVVPNPYENGKQEGDEEKPAEAPKTGRKRTRKEKEQ